MSPNPAVPFEQIDVETFAQRFQTERDKLQLIDVREPTELELASLEGFERLPLSEFADWSESIHNRFDNEKETIVMCHHGMRSAQMCQWLSQQGFTNVKNLAGGIDAYSAVVDRSVPRY
ncbi:rhodanese-like domain-containing protein [Pseudanabaena sp. FACHB-2040]|uniref:rhodanese-like domain-containing protein n=1 Tax=Pseudanabaena sp. FACHB-2040 TaxID=2692859 RepID=UPI001688ECED|nr:rhodanese-like domain-containing protein [Pseudanabaena sp. FACHB-2040]MBD2260510.1 rhodanese-related sulfurtransferase [Pseudanabaena sp. FACHB-2040]